MAQQHDATAQTGRETRNRRQTRNRTRAAAKPDSNAARNRTRARNQDASARNADANAQQTANANQEERSAEQDAMAPSAIAQATRERKVDLPERGAIRAARCARRARDVVRIPLHGGRARDQPGRGRHHHLRGPGLRDAARRLVERRRIVRARLELDEEESARARGDHLFAWKWKDGAPLDRHSATDADTDIALALLLAARRFENPDYESEALEIIRDIWNLEILPVGGAYYPIAGDWARREPVVELHVAYLAPYAYQEFAKVDSEHPWKGVVDTSYAILHWLYFDRGVKLPPEKIWVDAESGALRLEDPKSGEARPVRIRRFPDLLAGRARCDAGTGASAWLDSDLVPLLRKLGIEPKGKWKQQAELAELHDRMLAPLRAYWDREQRIYDQYEIGGKALSNLEALPLYATAHSLAELADPPFAQQLHDKKLWELRTKALEDRDTPYYLHNWLWFDEAFWLGEARRLDEPLGFLLPVRRAIVQGEPARRSAATVSGAVPARTHHARDDLAVADARGLPRRRIDARRPVSLVARDELAEHDRAVRPGHQHLAAGRRDLLLRIRPAAPGAGRDRPRPPSQSPSRLPLPFPSAREATLRSGHSRRAST